MELRQWLQCNMAKEPPSHMCKTNHLLSLVHFLARMDRYADKLDGPSDSSEPDVAVEVLFNIFISGVTMVTAYLLYLGLEAYEARQASKKQSAGQPSRSSAAETETRRVKLEINVDKPES